MGRLDNDFYSFTMGQFVWRHYPDVRVRYELRDRHGRLERLGQPVLQVLSRLVSEEIEVMRCERFTAQDLLYLGTLGFDAAYLAWLASDHELPEVLVELRGDSLRVEYEGAWADAIFWETPLLALVSSTYSMSLTGMREGERRLAAKIDDLGASPNLRFMEFGTRRRYSRGWQRYVIDRLVGEVGHQLLGTSNVEFAKEFDLRPLGTMAHQVHMVSGAVRSGSLVDSQVDVLRRWEEMYGLAHRDWLVLLPDTFGTLHFLRDVAPDFLARWPAVRQDSGDPFEVGQWILDAWQAVGVPTHAKRLIFSDGLDLPSMSRLHARFSGETSVRFGWGTGLTNDMGVDPPSVVIKPVQANGLPCVKLSDDPAKATGDAEAVQQYLTETAHSRSVECREAHL
ncbi:MAG TPA: hypothetical protein VM328_10945 [Fimbriimonadaceae bacterium]|nr:hypothetical protein [Fimbriimonadaceae bacterium]